MRSVNPFPDPESPRKVAAALIEKRGRVLIARRKTGDPSAGRWEFPGGKIERGETPEEGLRREILEELDVEVEVGEFLCGFPFGTASRPMELLVYRTRIVSGTVRCSDHDEARWVDSADLSAFDLTEPDRLAVERLFSGLPGSRKEGAPKP
jgi:8-oxo-dGTP diphosphatase